MSLADIWRFHFVRVNYWHGYEDGLAGRPLASSQTEYGHGYRRGQHDRKELLHES